MNLKKKLFSNPTKMVPGSHYRSLHKLGGKALTSRVLHCRKITNTTTTTSTTIKDFSEIPGPLTLPLTGNIHLYKLGM